MPEPRFRWNEVAGRYIDLNGQFVRRETVRLELDRALKESGNRATNLMEDLRAGRISLTRWRLEMRELVKETHLYSAAAARGGWDQLDSSDYGRVGQILSRGPKGGFGQYEYLERFADEIATRGGVEGNDFARARMYAEAGRGTYHTFDQQWHEDNGFDEERSIRHTDDSCVGCVAAEALGWQKIGTIPPIGSRNCLANCRCTMEHRKSSVTIPPRKEVQDLINRGKRRQLQNASDRTIRLANDLAAGRIDVETWQREMREILSSTGIAR